MPATQTDSRSLATTRALPMSYTRCLPLLVRHSGYIAKHYGWQWGMWAPGAAALAVGAFALAAARCAGLWLMVPDWVLPYTPCSRESLNKPRYLVSCPSPHHRGTHLRMYAPLPCPTLPPPDLYIPASPCLTSSTPPP